jgi:hypothetical protein
MRPKRASQISESNTPGLNAAGRSAIAARAIAVLAQLLTSNSISDCYNVCFHVQVLCRRPVRDSLDDVTTIWPTGLLTPTKLPLKSRSTLLFGASTDFDRSAASKYPETDPTWRFTSETFFEDASFDWRSTKRPASDSKSHSEGLRETSQTAQQE